MCLRIARPAISRIGSGGRRPGRCRGRRTVARGTSSRSAVPVSPATVPPVFLQIAPTGRPMIRCSWLPDRLSPDRGEAHDLVEADHLLPDMEADTLIADKTFDADKRVIEPLSAAGKTAVIPPKSNRKQP